MADQLIRIEGLLDSPVAVPPEDLTWTTKPEYPGEAFLKIRLLGITGADVTGLDEAWTLGKKYRLQFHPNEVINDATILSMKFDPPETAHDMTLHKEVSVLFQYETKNYNR